jgi:hypothetical protein
MLGERSLGGATSPHCISAWLDNPLLLCIPNGQLTLWETENDTVFVSPRRIQILAAEPQRTGERFLYAKRESPCRYRVLSRSGTLDAASYQ